MRDADRAARLGVRQQPWEDLEGFRLRMTSIEQKWSLAECYARLPCLR